MQSSEPNVFNRLLCLQLQRALKNNNIYEPTDVQKRSLPLILEVCNIIQ